MEIMNNMIRQVAENLTPIMGEIREAQVRREFLEELASRDLTGDTIEEHFPNHVNIENKDGTLVKRVEGRRGRVGYVPLMKTFDIDGVDREVWEEKDKIQLTRANIIDYLERKLHFHEHEKVTINFLTKEHRKIRDRLYKMIEHPEERTLSSYTINSLKDYVRNQLEEFKPLEERIAPVLEYYDAIYMSEQTYKNLGIQDSGPILSKDSQTSKGGSEVQKSLLLTVGLFVYETLLNPFVESLPIKMLVWRTDRCMTDFMVDEREWSLNLHILRVQENGVDVDLRDHEIHRAVLLHPELSKKLTLLVHLKSKSPHNISCLQVYAAEPGETTLNKVGLGSEQDGNYRMDVVDDVQQFKVNNARSMILVRTHLDSLKICRVRNEGNPFENMQTLLMPTMPELKGKTVDENFVIVEYQFVEREAWASNTNSKIEVVALTKEAHLLIWTFSAEEMNEPIQGTFLCRSSPAPQVNLNLKYGRYPFSFSFSSCVSEKQEKTTVSEKKEKTTVSEKQEKNSGSETKKKNSVYDKVIIFSFHFPKDEYTQGRDIRDIETSFKTTHLWATHVLFTPDGPRVWHLLCVEKQGDRDCSFAVKEFKQFDAPKYILEGLTLRSQQEARFLNRGPGCELVTIMPKADPTQTREQQLESMKKEDFTVAITLPIFNCTLMVRQSIVDKISDPNILENVAQAEQDENIDVIRFDNREVLQLVSSEDKFHKDEVRCLITQPQTNDKIRILVM